MIPAQRKTDLEAYYYDSEYYFTEDVDMYLELLKDVKGPIVEFACGSGRILIPLAERGHRLIGIDKSQEMLDIAKKKTAALSQDIQDRIAYVHADMLEYSEDVNAAAGILAFNSLLLLQHQQEQARVLSNLFQILRPGGVVLLSCVNPNLEWNAEKDHYLKFYGTWTNQHTQLEFDRFYSNTLLKHEQRAQYHLLYDEVEDSGKIRRRKNFIALRYLYSFEVQQLLEQAGFTIDSLYGDYDFSTYASDSRMMIFLASKPDPDS